MFIKRMSMLGKFFGSKEAKVAAAVAAAVSVEGAMPNPAEASSPDHRANVERVEKHEASGMNAGIKLALEKATEGRDENTGVIEEGPYTVSYERKDGSLVATVTVEEGGKKETKRILVGERKTGVDDKGNDIYVKVAIGDADALDELAKLKKDFKTLEATSDNDNNKIASEE